MNPRLNRRNLLVGTAFSTVALALAPSTGAIAASSGFVDVPSNHPFVREINWMCSSGITTGWKTSRGSEFRPTAPIARDAMAVFLYRYAGSPQFNAPSASPFVDVATSNKFYKEICWFHSQGITTGWKTSRGSEFRPTAPVARDAMAVFLYRFQKVQPTDTPTPAPTEKPSEPTTGTYQQQVAAEVLRLVNSERAKVGRGPVERHAALEKVAQNWSNVMASEDRLYHNPNYSQQYPMGWRSAAENVAQHFYDDNPKAMAAKLMQAWMNSPGHRTNILAQGTNKLGFGIATTSVGKVYACQNFAQY